MAAVQRDLTRRLQEAGLASPLPEARALLMHVLHLDWTGLVLASGRAVTPDERDALEDLLRRRVRGVPLQHLLGEVEWGGVTLRVTGAALVPRPETEVLLDLTLAVLEGRPGAALLDVGTGTGALALAVAAARPDVRVTASDVSVDALRLARVNAERLGLDVSFLHSDLLAGVAGRFAVIVSNPPYLPDADRASATPEVRHDPDLALYGGPDGLTLVRVLMRQAPACLERGGCVLLELDPRNVHVLAAELAGSGWRTEVRADLTGRDRFLLATLAAEGHTT
ncbi:release factor glutamine methyltransferase [Deinococcus aquiradiocola]|uniref:Release factor glutamine methyltransferase n=1 Tax=Deinococcus aquiradiocola TaxID=393059 RepID=A0A917PFG8_9DEIO|nr:release factor glutamine methyltransferase [Deinococcus aquiradiocola]